VKAYDAEDVRGADAAPQTAGVVVDLVTLG
jgi:hypothetical protein